MITATLRFDELRVATKYNVAVVMKYERHWVTFPPGVPLRIGRCRCTELFAFKVGDPGGLGGWVRLPLPRRLGVGLS